MASSYFSINPTGGTGNANITVAPLSTNPTKTDRVATITINDKTVRVTQYGVPYLSPTGGTAFVAYETGQTVQFQVHTHYPVQFRNKPSWITIDDGNGNTISSSQTIQPNVANGKVYNFVIAPNTGTTQRTTSNFGLWHYVGGTLQNDFTEVSVTQPAGADNYLYLVPFNIDWDDTSDILLGTRANVTYTVSNSNTSEFTLTGTDGTEKLRANDVNTNNIRKDTTITLTSTDPNFVFTTAYTFSQLREPIITLNGGSSIPWSGGTKEINVVSDYYWWLKPTVNPDTNAHYDYITMSGKTADENIEPQVNGHNYQLTWDSNTGATTRNDVIRVGYIKNDNTVASSTTSAEFSQANQASTTLEVVPQRVPSTGYAPNTGGVYTLEIITNRPWISQSSRQWCSVSPTSGIGNTTVAVTVPPASASSQTYRIADTLTFLTNDAEMRAWKSLSVYQYDIGYPVQVDYLTITNPSSPTTVSSASGHTQIVVSASTDWVVDEKPDWITLRKTVYTASSIVTGGTSGSTTFYAHRGENSGYTRGDSIVLSADNLSATLVINQDGIPLPTVESISITPSSFTNVSSGLTMFFNNVVITASTTWEVISAPDWFSLRETALGNTPVTNGSAGETQLYVRIEANSGDVRSGTMTIQAGDATATLFVSQKASGQ